MPEKILRLPDDDRFVAERNMLLAKKVVVVGTGYWGKNLVRNFYELESLYGICDIDESALRALKDKYPEVTTFTDSKGPLEDPAVSAVVISTPVRTHYALVKEALSAHPLWRLPWAEFQAAEPEIQAQFDREVFSSRCSLH